MPYLKHKSNNSFSHKIKLRKANNPVYEHKVNAIHTGLGSTFSTLKTQLIKLKKAKNNL